ncbi:MAG TPA: hypothetical protein VKE70_12360 [Candidatus Solibacter sp.]|nr:hypothetical protein [Candidatus Solibacter sp.]
MISNPADWTDNRTWRFQDPRNKNYRADLMEQVPLPDFVGLYDADHMVAKTAAIAGEVRFVPLGWLSRPINQRVLGGFANPDRQNAPDVKAARDVRAAMAAGNPEAVRKALEDNLDAHLRYQLR